MKEENQTIIKAINMFGRVPEMWELLNEIEKLNNIINELENIIDIEMNKMGYAKYDSCLVLMKMKINELKGSDKNE